MVVHMKNKKASNKNFIISVESRKGGVGKTTAALCMSRLLKQFGYTVLVLDLDVTGTNAADIGESPFWESDLNIVKQKGDPINLLTLFEQSFLTGQVIPDFSVNSNLENNMQIELDRVNVIGSQIYKANTEDGNGETCIERPGILFDDLHTVWLLEFIKQIIKKFKHVVPDDPRSRTAIILDNSPGYVGIAPAIHEWLTDNGPQYSKFLTVASLDAQDLSACERAMYALHRLYTTKWQTSCFFADLRPENNLDVKKEQEAFFIRLATSSTDFSNDPLAFYKKKGNHTEPQGQLFCDDPKKYIGVVINRVPRAVKTGIVSYKFPSSKFRNDSPFYRVLSAENKQGWQDCLVSYDEYIENQFLLPFLYRSHSHMQYQKHGLMTRLEAYENVLQSLDATKVKQNLFEHGNLNFKRLHAILIKSNGAVKNARTTIEDDGFGHLSRLIHEEWMPERIIPDFRNALSRFFRKNDLLYYEIKPNEDYADSTNQEEKHWVRDLMENITMEFGHHYQLERKDQIINMFVEALALLVGLSMPSQIRHPSKRNEISSLFSAVLAIELEHFSERDEKYSLQRFLAQESVEPMEIRKKFKNFEESKFMHHHMMRKDETGFENFYRACTTAQARLIDIVPDSKFLLSLLRYIVEGEMNEKISFPFVRGIAQDVIINKSVSHEEAESNMSRALRTAEYFGEFELVLKKILRTWGVMDG